jgi:soluble P-type ATPase
VLQIDIPGGSELRLEYLLLDYNGTLACHGLLEPGLGELLCSLSQLLTIHVVTADTFGLASENLDHLPVSLFRLGPTGQSQAKLEHLTVLGPERTVAVGNGLNDHLMIQAARLGITILGPEGASAKSLAAADVVCPSAASALELLLYPQRLIATLRD